MDPATVMITTERFPPMATLNHPVVQLLRNSSIAVATSEDFVNHGASTVFISWESSCEQSGGLLSELTDQVLDSLHGQLVLEIVKRAPVKVRRPRGFNIFIVDSPVAFNAIYATISPELYNFSGRYLIIVLAMDNVDELEIVNRILQQMWKYYMVNANVLFASSVSPDKASMYTYFPYGKQYCEEVQPILWNAFSGGRFVLSRNHYPSKLDNLHSCPLKIALYSYSAFMQLRIGTDGRVIGMDGIDVRLLNYLAGKLNFTIVPQEVPNGLRFGLIYANGTATGAMQMVIGGEVNFTVGYFGYNFLRHKYMSLSQIYHYSELVVVVSPGQEFEAFEKLLLPYSNTLWFAFVGCIVCGFLVIISIARMPAAVQSFVFGRLVRTPLLNLINVLFGGSLNKLPGRNFARFLLAVWFSYGIILRSIYQQALFNFIQHSPNHSTPSTFEQLVDSDYGIYLIPSEVYVFDHMPEFQPLIRVVPNPDIQRYDDAIRNGRLRGVRISNYEKVLFDNSHLTEGRKFRMLKQRLYNYALCAGLRKNSCLTKPFDDAILRLNTNGLVQAWVKLYVDTKYASVIETISYQQQKLRLGQLLGAFQVLTIGLCGCTVIFAIEIIWSLPRCNNVYGRAWAELFHYPPWRCATAAHEDAVDFGDHEVFAHHFSTVNSEPRSIHEMAQPFIN
ncbi:uncharacterized protein LOC131676212 [Topomyia yanbarensis]|uniref:uncharacterized protein LOC131676212 n=1 Tax=Topomyia yanbarensis TaxID=2498891 RepID=UPI00273C14C4|nr:uncharacterized protein LOC131676212 [Topomyia yanbarensis]